MEATRPILYRTTIFADPTTTWGCEISSLYLGRAVEHGTGTRARPTLPKGDKSTGRYLQRNQISRSDPPHQHRDSRHPFLQPHPEGNLIVRGLLCSADSSNHSFALAGDHVADESIRLLRPVLSKSPGGHPSTPNQSVEPSTSYEKKSSQKSTMYSATKLAIHMVKESSDVFPPLKSVAGGLSAILNHCDVWPTFILLSTPVFISILANSGMSSSNRIIDTPC